MEEQRKTDLFSLCQRKDHFRLLPVKEPLLQRAFVCHDPVQQVFIRRQFPDKPQDQRRIRPLRRAEPDGVIHRLIFSRFSAITGGFRLSGSPIQYKTPRRRGCFPPHRASRAPS